MRGDFSRIRFQRDRHYTSVLEQQGRVSLDADHNEQRAIEEFLRRTEIIDVIGPYGGPEDDEGFAITISGDSILIGAGRYYVQGLLCHNPDALAYTAQPYLLNPAVSDQDLLAELSSGSIDSIRLFLEVWQRLVTPLDDPCLREPALGQADTTVRLQTVWRVVADRTLANRPRPQFPLPAGIASTIDRRGLSSAVNRLTASAVVLDRQTPAPAPQLGCCQQMYLPPAARVPGKLAAQTTGASSDCSCQPTPAAGFRGLENQLYRVEIHDGGDAASATFKWSRENGSVAVAVTSIGGADVVVASLGPDANLGFQPGEWVELIDDTYLFGPRANQPGELFQIKNVKAEQLTLTMTAAVANVDPQRNARVRRWEQAGAAVQASAWLDLENGIQVQFAAGTFQSGDYWLIPARTATGQIEWPPCGSDGAVFQPPHEIKVYRAPLACIRWNDRQQFVIDDCRRKFPPLTEVAGGALSALHVTQINWNNDDFLTFDQLLAAGLAVTFDQAPTSAIDSSIFSLLLEVPIASPLEARAVTTGLAPIILRTAMPLDGQVTVKGTQAVWNLPFRDPKGSIASIQLEALGGLQLLLTQGANYSAYTRARIRLSGRNIFSGSGASRAYLDGQAFGTPGVRADKFTPHMDVSLPSGAGDPASDFESWFFLAPTLLLTALSVAPPTVTFSPSVPAPPTPVATLSVNYPALQDTTVTLSVVNPPNAIPAVTLPATVVIPRGKDFVTFNVGIRNTGTNAVQVFQIVASLPNALNLTSTVTATLALTGFQIIK